MRRFLFTELPRDCLKSLDGSQTEAALRSQTCFLTPFIAGVRTRILARETTVASFHTVSLNCLENSRGVSRPWVFGG